NEGKPSMHALLAKKRRKTRLGAGMLVLSAATALGVAAVVAPSASAQTATGAQRAGSGGALSISKQYFGSTTDSYTGKLTPTYRYTMTNAHGMSVDLLSYGGITQEINVPGKNGAEADVVLGFST